MASTTTSAAADPIDATTRAKMVDSLQGRFSGMIIEPGQDGYEQARLVWNAMVDKRPGLILTCTSTPDVVAAVDVAREFGLAPSVRCGGHHAPGEGVGAGRPTLAPGGPPRG